MRNFSDKIVEKIETHFMFNNISFRKLCLLWNNVEKFGTAEQATDDNVAQAHCMLVT